MNKTALKRADILLPNQVDMTKWSVVACDQYTSQPDYWQRVEALVEEEPSTLRITLPEIYLEQPGVEQRIEKINATMRQYLKDGLFCEYKNRYLYVERTLQNGSVRRGVIGMLDLEEYDYHPGAKALIRATEGTVLERIPPRVQVRQEAPLECPHVMMLIDDRQDAVIGPLASCKEQMEQAYAFSLMENSGSIAGWLLPDQLADRLEAALSDLASPSLYREKYGVTDSHVFLFASGDGNHSLATAKACWEKVKETLPQDQWESCPARYALAEVVNLHDSSLEFEPIHRVVFGVDAKDLLEQLKVCFELTDDLKKGQSFDYQWAEGAGTITIANPSSNLAVGTLQGFLDDYIKTAGGRVDYIHGEDTVHRLAEQPGNIGFLLPAMEKNQLFETVIMDGVLPRKTFSMGHAQDKRFYLECRRIRG